MTLLSLALAAALSNDMNPPTQEVWCAPTSSAANLVCKLQNVTFVLGKANDCQAKSLTLFKNSSTSAVKGEIRFSVRSHGIVPGKADGPTVLLDNLEAKRTAMDQAKTMMDSRDSAAVATTVETVYRYAVSVRAGETLSVRASWHFAPAKIGLGGGARQIAYLTNPRGSSVNLEQFQASVQDPNGAVFRPIEGLCDWGKVEVGEKGAFVSAKNLSSSKASYFIFQYYPQSEG